MSNEIERRYTPGQVEVRADADKNERSIGGYAAKFDKQSRNLGGFVEIVRPSAFNKSRGDGWPDIQVRYNHDDMWLLGNTDAGTVTLRLDEVGLDYQVRLNPADPQAVTVGARVERGDVRKSSFAFRVMPEGEEWALNDLDIPLRSLLNVQLVDVAPVNSPAYADTTTGLRSLAVFLDVEFDEVRRVAAKNELRGFFKRTDIDSGKPRPDFGAAARMALLGRRTDPWV